MGVVREQPGNPPPLLTPMMSRGPVQRDRAACARTASAPGDAPGVPGPGGETPRSARGVLEYPCRDGAHAAGRPSAMVCVTSPRVSVLELHGRVVATACNLTGQWVRECRQWRREDRASSRIRWIPSGGLSGFQELVRHGAPRTQGGIATARWRGGSVR